jgi:hypothetical protein
MYRTNHRRKSYRTDRSVIYSLRKMRNWKVTLQLPFAKIWDTNYFNYCLILYNARPAATVNYRPVFSSERALQNNKLQLSKIEYQGERKIGRGSQMGAWHQDGLAHWLSVVMWLWLYNASKISRYRSEVWSVTGQQTDQILSNGRTPYIYSRGTWIETRPV